VQRFIMKNTLTLFGCKNLIVVLVVVFLLRGTGARADVAPVTIVSGETTQADGWLTATTSTVVELPVSPDTNRYTIRGKTGTLRNEKGVQVGGLSVAFLDVNGKTAVGADGKPMAALSLRASDLKLYGSETVYPDAYIQMPWPMRYFVRPNLALYDKGTIAKRAKNWDSLPKASESIFLAELRRTENGTLQFWFNGNFMKWYPAATFDKLRITLAPCASLQDVSATRVAPTPQLELPVQEYSRPDGMPASTLSFEGAAALPASLQKLAGATPGIAVDGLGVMTVGSDDLQSFFFRRTAAHALPEQRIFTVPLETYSYATILCAATDDPAKSNDFTLRVTRYGRTRGNAMADTIVSIPASNAKASKTAWRVGTVRYGPDNARKTATLWLLKVPIKNGLIQDILFDDDRQADGMGTYQYLDVELMNPLANVERADAFPPPQEVTGRAYRPGAGTNATVFGVVLEMGPAQMQVRSNIGAQAFYASDKPQYEATVTAHKAGEYSVAWTFADVDGKTAATGKKSVTLSAGGQSTLSVPVALSNGWYAARLVLSDSEGAELVDYRTSFVMLPPDTRKAGLESPYYGWFYNNHGAEKMTLDEVGPLLKRLGVRRVDLPEAMPESTTLSKYGFTEATIPWTRKGQGRFAMAEYASGKKSLEEAVAMQEEAIRETLKLWPSIDRMLVFHESGSGGAPFPSELWDEAPAPVDEKKKDAYEKSWATRMAYLDAMAKMVRAKFPQLKMQYGNDGSSLGLVGELLRRKFPREYIDTIASEDLGQWIPPERDLIGSTQDGWYLRELARKMGYADVPVTATTEWIGRMVDSGRPLGLRKQAEWKARDTLIALAYGYDTISVAGINDASDAYYYSIWANGGLTTRYPQLAPRPSYAAIATLTQVLDGAKFTRFVPSGSTVCNVQEFQRGDEWVYAVWTPRGARTVNLSFGEAANRTLTDLYGRQSTLAGKEVALNASTSVQYLASKTKLVAATVGKSAFPEDQAHIPAQPLQTIPLEKADALVTVADAKLEGKVDIGYISLRRMTQGEVELRTVEDSEMGQCLEIELKPKSGMTWRDVQYLTLNLPAPLVTKAKNAGLWIKGNGSWAMVDVLTEKEAPWRGNHRMDTSWLGDATLNFDGWNFIPYPARLPNSDDATVTGLRLVLPHTTLAGIERVPVENQKIRIKSIVLF
jgi:hypothetical protein